MSIVITVRVTPNAKRYRWVRMADGVLKCYVPAPAVDGKANQKLCDLISKTLGILGSAVTIISGQTSRTKRLQIESSLSIDQIELLLVDGIQQTLW